MPSGAYILAIDQGTTSSRALVVDGDGEVLGIGQQPFTQHYPRPGYVEHNPEDIWETTLEAIATALAGAGVAPAELATIGIANQRETVLLWDRESGEPVSPAVVWQDRRTAAQCNDLRERGLEDVVRARTGLAIDPYFSGTKLAWLLDDTRGLRAAADAGVVAAGTIDSWLLWKLTGGKRHATDYTNASRTLLFNTATCTWDDDLLALLDVPASLLPEACPSRADFGVTDAGVLGAEIPIGGIAGDQQAALFGQAGNLAPMTKGFVIRVIDGDGQLVRVDTPVARDQGPGVMDRLFLEIIAEGEVAEHLEEGVMPGGIADIVEIIMLAAGAHALLRGRRRLVGTALKAREHILERHHARVDEHERRIIVRYERRRGHHFMAIATEIIEEGAADIVGRSHDCRA